MVHRSKQCEIWQRPKTVPLSHGKFAAIPTCSPSDSLRLLFQDYDAYPWFTVQNNVRFGSGPKPFPSVTATQEMLHRVGLSASAKRYPAELSGGMKKRLRSE